MNFIDNIDRETLIICNNYVKRSILSLNRLKPIKFMSLLEFREKFYFSYDDNAILYVMDKYNVKYEIAKEYIDNLYYVEDKSYNNDKLDFLVNLKKDLDNNNLLLYNEIFKKYITRISIILYGIKVDNMVKKMLDGLNYCIIDRQYKEYEHVIYEFDTVEEEIQYIANEISTLIDNGISTNKIKLTNVDESYHNILERIFSLFNLKVSINYQRALSTYPLVKEFLNLYRASNLDIENVIDKLDKEDIIYDELIKVINKYIKYKSKELLIYKIENSYVNSPKYDNEIEIIDYLDYVSKDDEYVFMIGFNEGLIPKKYMDIDYITDNIKKYVGLDDTRNLNVELRNDTLKSIKDIKNLVITYKLRDYKRSYYPSPLCNYFNVIRKDIDYTNSYSEIYDKISLVKEYDNYIKYGYKGVNFDLLNNNYVINYNSYSNKFSGIDRIMDKLTLSYSKMQMYNKCAFRYYLSEILKLDIFEENFSTVIGSMVHYAMEKCLSNNDLNINKYVDEYLKGRVFTKKECFFLEKYKECIRELLDQIILEKEYALFNRAMYEKKIDIDYGNNVHFVGVIDKVLYYIDDNTTYIGLIDYKTGNDDISLKYLKYGLNIQLPIYLYLSTKLDFVNVRYVGFYLQKFNIVAKDYRLIGYSNSDKETLSVIDKCYDNSKVIKGLKTLKDGSFSKNSKILSNEDMKKIKESVSNVIDNVIDKIRNNKFDINPKVDGDKNIGCEFCKFNDICFKKREDEVKIFACEFGGDE